jgi:uncharacterized protein
MTGIGDIPDPGPRRRYSSRDFPGYRFVPGVRPHPLRDPGGHSLASGTALRRHAPWQPEEWRSLDDWLFGVDLFNAHFFWEAHEAWEGLWAAKERTTVPALFLQGLIQIAAAMLKTHLGSLAGVCVLSDEGLEKLRHIAEGTSEMMGLDLPEAIAAFASYFSVAARGELPLLGHAPLLRLCD